MKPSWRWCHLGWLYVSSQESGAFNNSPAPTWFHIRFIWLQILIVPLSSLKTKQNKKTALLRHNWCTMNNSYLDCIIWWVLTCVHTYEPITTIKMMNVSITPKVSWCHGVSHLLITPIPIPMPPRSLWVLSFHYRLLQHFWNFIEMELYKMYPFCLASFIGHNYCEIHPGFCTYQ